MTDHVQDIQFQFGCVEELQELLSLGEDDREVDLPIGTAGFSDGQWVLATFKIGDRNTSVAGCVQDRGVGIQLCFSDRDWQTLVDFSELAAPQSGPASVRCPPIAGTVSTEGTHILLIDGEAETRMVTQQLLEGAGYRVTAVSSAEQAFERLSVPGVDLIVCECTLPGMSGLDFCRQLKLDGCHGCLPLIFLTTHSSQRRVVEAFECGVDEYVTKPFRQHELSARVIGVLRRAHARAS
ncbi:MAG TPA: response regulator transcription factor [Polyangiaceae bacterium]|jgi:CheY-like chemotaxis protein|nr:response regulator transcription factor [Polyangiaceae bacterium]